MAPDNANPDPRAEHGGDVRPPGGRLSIGALSRATGIPVETLRTWEARYGFPVPERRPSGHRLYPAAIVPRLRRIAEALARGHRASQAVGADDTQLAELLHATMPADHEPATLATPGEGIEPLLDAVSGFDADRLTALLLGDWARFGLVEFLERRVGPLIREVGERWSRGSLEVRHEHFLTERISDVISTLRLPFEQRARGALIVFATLPSERHSLGLQMATLVAAASGCRVLSLGPDAPTAQIATLAQDIAARAVAISVSRSSAGPMSDAEVARLRAALPAEIQLVVGGEGAPAPGEGVRVVTDFATFRQWARGVALV